jgi:hypothetical protein
MNFFIVIVITSLAVFAMFNLRDWVNRSESIRAMGHLGRVVLEHRQKHGTVPPESYVDNIKQDLEGNVRLGILHYRARWIDFESPPDTILAYSEKIYPSSLLEDGYVVLLVDGTVKWIDKKEFEELFASQRKPMEILEEHR